ncbi:MAG: AmmeMemoRadiSam system protein A [Spirochaetaceae bacterium]|jgi:AmmeMemoRadiSam system protein A|nr:AmmeMemoRadiSam system protein A [Spirochaetaceae bacterium]
MKNEDKNIEESAPVLLARHQVEHFAREKTYYRPQEPLPEFLTGNKAGVFVSIHEKSGDLRGCIGTIAPVQKNIAEEILRNAVSASSEDPRFPPISADELDSLTYSVDILEPPEPIKSEAELDPKKYGVIVSLGYLRGLLLPNLDGVDTVDEQITIAMRKAGIPARERENIKLKRFLVTRYY